MTRPPLEALRHRPSHSTGTRRHVKNLFIALQNKHFSEFLGEISANPRGSPIKLRRVLRIMEMSFMAMPVAMTMFVVVSMLMVMTMFVTVAVLVVMSVFMIARVLMPGFMFMTALMSMFMLLPVAVLVMLMFVSMIVLMFVFVFFTHGFTIPSNEIRLVFACPHRSRRGVSTQPSGRSQIVRSIKISYNGSPLQTGDAPSISGSSISLMSGQSTCAPAPGPPPALTSCAVTVGFHVRMGVSVVTVKAEARSGSMGRIS